MDKNSLMITVVIALVGAVCLGWVLRWVFSGLNNGAGPRSIKQTSDIAGRLHEAEDAREAAVTQLFKTEAEFELRIKQLQAELVVSEENLAKARGQTEEIRQAYRDAMDKDPLRGI